MDPKTESEHMEDVRPHDRGFLADDQPDDEAREQLERDEPETSDEG